MTRWTEPDSDHPPSQIPQPNICKRFASPYQPEFANAAESLSNPTPVRAETEETVTGIILAASKIAF